MITAFHQSVHSDHQNENSLRTQQPWIRCPKSGSATNKEGRKASSFFVSYSTAHRKGGRGSAVGLTTNEPKDRRKFRVSTRSVSGVMPRLLKRRSLQPISARVSSNSTPERGWIDIRAQIHALRGVALAALFSLPPLLSLIWPSRLLLEDPVNLPWQDCQSRRDFFGQGKSSVVSQSRTPCGDQDQ